MPIQELGPTEYDVTVQFGGGINSRSSEGDVRERECASGENFTLDLENNEFRPREYFDLAGTAPGGQINGYAQLKKIDGTVSTLIQSGTSVYTWDGDTFTLVGSVASGAKIRGPIWANWLLDEKVIITDVGMVQPVMEWDGTTLSNISHNLTGAFVAKYCYVDRDRAHYANVSSNGTLTPHVTVGSAVENYDSLSVSDKPSSALGVGDAWYVTQPDLKPINGLVTAFGRVVTSSVDGNLYQLLGNDSKDFAFDEFYPGSAADGDEPMAYVGSDIIYGRPGRIESLGGTASFGDVETDDLSRFISDQVKDLGDWTVVYNSRLSRVYFYSSETNHIWVLHKSVLDESNRKKSQLSLQNTDTEVSPWSKWTTQHSFDFRPTCMWVMFDPSDGLEYTWAGDSSGNIYRLEGDSDGDAGSSDVSVTRVSKVYSVPLNSDAFDIEGFVEYKKDEAASLTLSILFAGSTPLNESFTITFDALSGRPVYGGSLYYGGGNYYSTPFKGRFVRKTFAPAGQGTSFQVQLDIEGSTNFNVSQVGLRFEATS